MKRAWLVLLACAGLGGCATVRPTKAPEVIAATEAAGAATTEPRMTLALTYLGVAGWSISDGKHVVLVDPYFSRPADPRLGFAVADEQAIAARAPAKADVILVGHGHVDHALDAPAIAKRTGAALVGSADVARQAHAAGVPDAQIRLARGGEDYAFDGFSVRVIPSLHSLIGFADGGDVQTFAFLVRMGGQQIFVLDTANYIEREVAGLRPDVAIVATGLREQIHDYSCRLMRLLGRPRRVFTTHFDQWKKPAETPLTADERADLAQFTDEIHRCAPATEVIVPAPFVTVRIP